MDENGLSPDRYALIVDRGKGTRKTALAVVAYYEDPADGRRKSAVFHLEEIDATVPGSQLGGRVADLLAVLDPGIPVHVKVGITLDGRRYADKVLMPAVRARLGDLAGGTIPDVPGDVADQAAELLGDGLTYSTYAVDTRGSRSDVGRKVSLHRRVADLSVSVELAQLKIMGYAPLADEAIKALKSFDPSKRVTDDGRDTWGTDDHEGLLTALAMAADEHREAHIYAPQGNRGNARMVSVTSPDSGWGMAPASYVGGHPVFGVDGTALGRGGFGQRADHLLSPETAESSPLRPKRIGRVVDAWAKGEELGPDVEPSPVQRSTARVRQATRGPSLVSPPVYGPLPGEPGAGPGYGAPAGGIQASGAPFPSSGPRPTGGAGKNAVTSPKRW